MNEEEQQKRVQNEVDSTPEITEEPLTPVIIQRENGGKFKRGLSANPSGKPKGALTRKTERLKMLMDSALVDRWERYLQAMDNLDDKTFVQEYRQLLEFRFPKVQRESSNSINIQNIKEQQTIKIGETEFIIN